MHVNYIVPPTLACDRCAALATSVDSGSGEQFFLSY